MLTIRDYAPSDWPRLCEIQDAARRRELALAGLEAAFLPLETAAEREGLTVQVYSNSGALIRQYEPEDEPITVDGLDAAGVYVVRIVDGLGNVYTGKIIVR